MGYLTTEQRLCQSKKAVTFSTALQSKRLLWLRGAEWSTGSVRSTINMQEGSSPGERLSEPAWEGDDYSAIIAMVTVGVPG